MLHRQYLQDLLSYLEQFYDRTNPLGSLTKVYGKLGFDFDSAFEEGQVPGWEDWAAGKVPGQQGSAMDLQAFDTVDELESLGLHNLPCMCVSARMVTLRLTPLEDSKALPLQQLHRRDIGDLHCKCPLFACLLFLALLIKLVMAGLLGMI